MSFLLFAYQLDMKGRSTCQPWTSFFFFSLWNGFRVFRKLRARIATGRPHSKMMPAFFKIGVQRLDSV
jgi:hypothetical protein